MRVDLILFDPGKQFESQKQGKESDALMFNNLTYIG